MPQHRHRVTITAAQTSITHLFVWGGGEMVAQRGAEGCKGVLVSLKVLTGVPWWCLWTWLSGAANRVGLGTIPPAFVFLITACICLSRYWSNMAE